MPTAGDQLPADTTTLARRVASLEREVGELRAARRLEAASVGAGGLRVVDGGRLSMDTPGGNRMVDIGEISNPTYNHADGTPQQAMWLRREDGSGFMSCFSYPPSGFETQAWKFTDRTGGVVFAEDTNSGQGLSRPYLPVPMQHAYDGGWDYWPRTTSTSMTELWAGRMYKQLPHLVIVIRASMDTAAATGQIDVTIDGVSQGATSGITFGVGYYQLGPYDLGGDHMDSMDIAVRGRRVTGTGTIRAGVIAAYNM